MKSQRSVRISLLTAILVIVILSSVFVYYYLSSSSEMSAKDRLIGNMSNTVSSMNSTISTQNNSIITLRSSQTSLNAQIQALNSEIATLRTSNTNLQSNLSASNAEIQTLSTRVSVLKNESSELQLELSLVEQVGKLSVNVFAFDQTITVAGHTTFTFLTYSNGYNGTIEYLSPKGCPSPNGAISTTQHDGQLDINATLDTNGPYASLNFTDSLTPTPFGFYFQNVGPSSVTCTFSLIYVYDV